jgi:serine/threonine protein kinase/class 3 adenylate cyclase
MTFGSFELVNQVGSGVDGVSYLARDCQSRIALLHDLSRLRDDPVRWEPIAKRLRALALLDHPVSVQIEKLQIDGVHPYVVQEWLDCGVLADWRARVPVAHEIVIGIGLALAEGLAEAHRIGLTHGQLHPRTILMEQDRFPRLDFTGLKTSSVPVDETRIAETLEVDRSGEREGSPPTPMSDVRRLGEVLQWLSGAGPPRGSKASPAQGDRQALANLVREMCAEDPVSRPSAHEAADRLRPLRDSHSRVVATIDSSSNMTQHVAVSNLAVAPHARVFDPATTHQLGRYRLLESLGQGGMGAVYRARDASDGTIVAIKVLRPEWASRPISLRRFQKEARLLAEVNNPFVTNLLEVNEDEGVHYLVLEFVAGTSLGSLLAERGRLEESVALGIAADVSRALADAHERGIVHRDVKPDNILVELPEGSRVTRKSVGAIHVKLSDFGLARHVVESESLQMTQAGIVGTPHYMAPEQCSGREVDSRTDVYALGATLFHMLAGRPPFEGAALTELLRLHREAAPPPIGRFNTAVSEGTCRIVEKALAKAPGDRYFDAAALLEDIERVLRGEPSQVGVHPRLPQCDERSVLIFDFTWDLESAPRDLWPHVSNTERLNRAIGLPAVAFTAEAAPTGKVRRFASAKVGGLPAVWEEHPFEWVEPRRFGVLREYSRGPFKWFVSLVELTPRESGGTRLSHRVRLEPRIALMRPFIAARVGRDSRKVLEQVYRRIDASVSGKLGRGGTADPFEASVALAPARRRRLDQLLGRLVERGVSPSVVEDFGEFLANAPAQEVARIRPLAVARQLGLDIDDLVAACLIGAQEGLLTLLWDLLCPVCRIPSEVVDTLRNLRDHGRCAACNLDYELDLANSVEMIFRAHQDIRDTELGVYCIGGPAHSPHVVAQVRVAPGERLELNLELPDGHYQIRGPQLPGAVDLRLEPSASQHRLELSLGRIEPKGKPYVLRTGRQTLIFLNDHAQELIVRVERTVPRDDALTAARASAMALFRELFPNEVLAAGRLINVATITLLLTDLVGSGHCYVDLGDARAFAIIHEHLRLLDEAIRLEGGALVKTVGEGVFAAFTDSAAAVRVALSLQQRLAQGANTKVLQIRVAVHRGSAMAATLNDHLDYFGATVHVATRLLSEARPGEVLLSQAVANEPEVASLLHARGAAGQIVRVESSIVDTMLAHRIAL